MTPAPMRIALGVEYDGSGFAGWERQRRQGTVQGALEGALARVADRPVRVVCAGRTDAGVHAWGQVAHFDTQVARTTRAWVYGGNANLPPGVGIAWAREVDSGFHARFSARARRYRYLIYNHPVRPAVLRERVAWECRPLEAEWMREGAGYLLGEHDFSAYRASACQARSPVRRVHRLEVTRHGAVLAIDVVANAFLHHMVRNIAGVLMAIGMGRQPPRWARDVLEGRERARGGVTAPPQGLYLMEVEYPPEHRLPGVQPPPLIW